MIAEAAARVQCESHHWVSTNVPGLLVRWVIQCSICEAYNVEEMNAAFDAAAPLAEAFDQGQKSGMRHADRLVAAAKIGMPELPGPISPNPYRPTK